MHRSFAEYLDLQGVNWSRLKHMRESPARYFWRLEHPEEDSATLAIGRATHALVFEPGNFRRDYVLWHGGRRSGQEWDEFRASHEDVTILKPDEFDLAQEMAHAVRCAPSAQQYLDGGTFEQAIQWTDLQTGIRCKARPDVMRQRGHILADLKTCVSIDARRFGQACHRLGYAPQLAHYAAGIRAAHGWTPEKVVLIAVEKTPPHEVAVFVLQPEQLDTAAEEVAALLARVRECSDAGSWPGRYPAEIPLQLPSYVDGELEIEYE